MIIKKEDRDNAVQEILTSGVKLKNFYRFTVQNPHLELNEASQILSERTNASICFSFDRIGICNGE